MKLTSVVKWMLLIGLSAIVVVGVTGIHFWSQRHDLVQTELLRMFERIAPDLKLVLGKTHVNGTHGVTLLDVELQDCRTNQPVLRARSITVRIDSDMLLDHQRVSVRAVEVDSADVRAVRHKDGHWNWQQYHWNLGGSTEVGLPQIDIRQLRVLLHLQHGDDIPPARLLLASSRLQAVPASAQKVDLSGSVDLPGVGALGLSGGCDLVSGEWSLAGDLRDVTADHDLFRLVRETSPALNERLAELESAVRRMVPSTQMASRDSATGLMIGRDSLTAPRFHGQLDVDFDVAGGPARPVPRFQLLVDIRDGRISVPGIPIQLSQVRAAFYCDNENVRLSLFHAGYEDSQLAGEFSMRITPDGPPPVVDVVARNFPFSSHLRPLFPLWTRWIFSNFKPELRVSGTGRLVRQTGGRWQLQDARAKVHDGRIRHHRFYYPLTGIEAEIVQRPVKDTGDVVILDVTATGLAGDREWTTTGWWKNPGRETESRFTTSIAEFPLDARFRDALEPAARKVIDALDLGGIASARLDFYRPPGLDQKTDLLIDADVSDGTIRFQYFPLEISHLSGHVAYDSRTRHWSFQDVQGCHGGTEVSCVGEFAGRTRPGLLELTVSAKHLALDADLYNALTPSQRDLWELLDPAGQCDLTARIHWTAALGQGAIVRFPEEAPIRVYNGRIRPQPFPYEIDIDEAVLSFNPNDPRYAGVQYCEVHSFTGSHDGAPISAKGSAELSSDGHWKVHLSDLTASQLAPDDELRAALPNSWRETVTRLHHRGRVSVHDSEIEFRGISGSEGNVTAAWDMQLELHDCTMDAGLEVQRLSGSIAARGSWNGFQLQNHGEIKLDSAEVLQMPLTRLRGPYSIDNDELVLGARSMLVSGETRRAEPEQRLRAQAYGGTVYLDGLVSTSERGDYYLLVQVEQALLQSYARRHMPNAGQLEGDVSAWLALRGNGDAARDVTGQGQLEISPAKLYQLPVIVELLSALASMDFNVRNRTAFGYALLMFDVRRERFEFSRIDLVGPSLALRGRGSVGFGGDVALDFYSRPPRPGPLTIPLLNLLVNGATQWAGVRVRGTTQHPQTTVQPTTQLDESMRQFLNSFSAAPGMIPGLSVPRVFPFPAGPLSKRPRPPAR